LLKTSERRTQKESTVVDAGFCHGACGVAYMFYKMWINTEMHEFKISSDYWFRETFNYGAKYNEISEYKYLIGNFESRKFQPFDQLLEGNCGVAISYLCYLYPDFCDWDECILLS